MATLIEVVGSRDQVVSKEDPTYPLKLQVFGDDCYDDAVVRSTVEAYLPAFLGSMVYSRYELHDQGAGNWLVDVYYGRKYARTPGDMYIHFDFGTEKSRAFVSKSSNYFPALSDPTNPSSSLLSTINFHQAINVKDSGSKRRVEGTEVEDPTFTFTLTRVFGPGYPITQGFINSLKTLRGKVNVSEVVFSVLVPVGSLRTTINFNFQGGELHFLGATGGLDEDTHQEIVLRFNSYENFSGTVAGVPNVFKPGFDYLWVAYEDDQDTTAVGGIGGSNKVVPRARQVCVEQLYDEADLGVLFI